MISANTIYAISATLAIAVVPVGRYVYTRIRKTAKREVMEAMKDAFILDMATNHLPHIYHALEVICRALNVELTEPPAINFVTLEGLNGTDKDSNYRTD
jgi:hypothetical protein